MVKNKPNVIQFLSQQGDLIKFWMGMTDCPKIEVDKIQGLYEDLVKSKCSDILNQRDKAYKSLVDGTQANAQDKIFINK